MNAEFINVTFIVLALIVVGLAVLGCSRGLITSVWHLAGVIIIIALTIMLAPTVAKALANNDKVYDKIYEKVKATVDANIPEGSSADIDDLIDGMNLPEAVSQMFKKSVEERNGEIETARQKMVESIYEKATNAVITGISYIITLIIVIILSAIGVGLLNKLFMLPGLNTVNKLGGFIFGFAEGILIVWVICGIAPAFAATEFGAKMIEHIQANGILRFFYEHNLVSTLITAKLLISHGNTVSSVFSGPVLRFLSH